MRDGELRIPTFQRPFRWRRRHVLDLLDSVYRGYPIGELLFSRQSAPAQTDLEFGPYRVDAPAVSEAWFVVDGQQRITALVGALMHPQPIPRTSVCAAWFDLEAERFVRLEKGTPRLSPAYDIVSTILYPSHLADPWLALSIGGVWRFDEIREASFEPIARACERSFAEVAAWVREAAERTRTAWAAGHPDSGFLDLERQRIEAHLASVSLP